MRYSLKPLTPTTLFPVPAKDCQHRTRARASDEYAELWHAFVASVTSIPVSYRANLARWLYQLDRLFLLSPTRSRGHRIRRQARSVAVWPYQGHRYPGH